VRSKHATSATATSQPKALSTIEGSGKTRKLVTQSERPTISSIQAQPHCLRTGW